MFRVKQFDKNGNLIKTWPNAKQVYKETGWSDHLIGNVCKGYGKIAYGFYWCYEGEESVLKDNLKSPKVVQYNLDGSVVKVWDNANAVHKEKGWSYNLILNVCKGIGKTAYGYAWSYENSACEYSKDCYFKNKKIIQYNKNGEIIKVWDKPMDVVERYGMKRSEFKKILSKRTATYKGFGWSYEGKSWGKNANTKIYQYDASTMKLVKIWQKISIAASELGIDASGISNCISKKIPHFKGYIWRRGLEQD